MVSALRQWCAVCDLIERQEAADDHHRNILDAIGRRMTRRSLNKAVSLLSCRALTHAHMHKHAHAHTHTLPAQPTHKGLDGGAGALEREKGADEP